ncbi:SGNH/GDSL hydrolase family protein [Streptomyces sp. NPDC090301]|uniref:SGNH/GDSL hydrolase family protein n=1 Tax=Streptomyces sp. NPDC090301 TaxID=3154975 RepID=UPI00342E8740
MLWRRIALSASTALAMAAAALGAAPPATAAGHRYVAVGDSYSSGVGAGSYLSDSGECRRSTNAYPRLWAAANSPSSFSFTACSGATTGSVRSGQLGPLDSSTTLVSVTAGGNDVGFADVMQTCVLNSEATCVAAVDAAVVKMNGTLPGGLSALYGDIRSRAPRAHVVVLGYPRFYKLAGSCIAGLSETERAAINRGSDTLNGVLGEAGGERGLHVLQRRRRVHGPRDLLRGLLAAQRVRPGVQLVPPQGRRPVGRLPARLPLGRLTRPTAHEEIGPAARRPGPIPRHTGPGPAHGARAGRDTRVTQARPHRLRPVNRRGVPVPVRRPGPSPAGTRRARRGTG